MDPEPMITPPPSKKPILLVILTLVLFLSTSYLAYQNIQLKKQIAALQYTPTPTPSPAEASVKEGTATWKTYTTSDHDIKISFKVPPLWSNLYGNFVEQSFAGEKGLQYCLTITKKSIMQKIIPRVHAGGGPCNIEWFGMGGLSKDYEAGRGGGFTDTNGFISENGKYFYLQNLNRKVDITPYVIDTYTNPNGITFLLVRGTGKESGEMAGIPIAGTPGSGSIGALINLPSGRIAGIGIEMNLAVGDESFFTQILSTFKFL